MSFYQLDFYSDILQREADVLIAAPAKQEDDCQVVYLLHGGGSDNKSWLPQKERLQEWAEQFQTVIEAEYDYTYLEPEQGQHDDAFWSKWMPEFLRFLRRRNIQMQL